MSLLTALLLMTIVGLAIVTTRLWREVSPLRDEVFRLRQELGYEAARYVFGRSAEFRRRMADDEQVKRALTLAQKAKTPQDLLSLAAAQPAQPTVHNR